MLKHIYVLSIIVFLFFLTSCQTNQFTQNSIKTWVSIDYNANLIFSKLGELYHSDSITELEKTEFIQLGNKIHKNLKDIKELLKQYVWEYNTNKKDDITLKYSIIVKLRQLVDDYEKLEDSFLLEYITSTNELIDIPDIYTFKELHDDN